MSEFRGLGSKELPDLQADKQGAMAMTAMGWMRSRLMLDGVRYFVASLAALALDFALLVALTRLFGVRSLLAATLGYVAGLVLIYGLCAVWVYRDRWRYEASLSFATFAAVGLVGLALTDISMYLLHSRAGLGLEVAKLFTVGGVFLFNFAGRRWLLVR